MARLHSIAVLALTFLVTKIICGDKYGTEKCVPFQKVGCFKDNFLPNRPLPHELLNRRDKINKNWDGYMINWKDYTTTLHALACKCGELARKRGHAFFGLQFYGECWSGPYSHMYMRDGASDDCIGVDYKPCVNEAKTECIGKALTNYIYSTKRVQRDDPPIPGGWSDWSSWTVCSKSCNGGARFRERTCTEPVPQFGGARCEGEGEQEQACNEDECEPVCKKALEVGIILDGSSSVTNKNWQLTLEFVKSFATEFSVNPQEVHFGVIHFQWWATLDFKISDSQYWNKAAFDAKVDSIRYPYGGTRTDLAIKMAENEFFCSSCGIRQDVPKVLIVLTDGHSSSSAESLDVVSQPLKDAGVNIMAIGIGAADEEELKQIATNEENVFMMTEYAYLGEKVNKLLKIACNSKV